MKEILENLKTHPAVFAAEDEYQIMVPVKEKCIMWVTVDGVDYFDASNGINRSETKVHRMTVPAKKLNSAKKYTVSYRKVINRKPYFPEFEDTVSAEYAFKPVESDKINIYLISDTHNLTKTPILAGKYFENRGEPLDLLVLNGDVPNDCGSVENFDTVYKIASGLTQGEIPAVFSRGNHDLRGIHAEAFAEYTPAYMGNTYYTVKVGPLWAILIDCGEDKNDTSAEYGGAVSCHSFRVRETEFIKDVIAKGEYNAKDVKYKLVISHVPFAHKLLATFDIESETYTEWCNLLRENIKPHLMLTGHLHRNLVSRVGGELDTYGQPCPVIVASKPVHPNDEREEAFSACAITLDGAKAKVVFNTDKGEILGEDEIEL